MPTLIPVNCPNLCGTVLSLLSLSRLPTFVPLSKHLMVLASLMLHIYAHYDKSYAIRVLSGLGGGGVRGHPLPPPPPPPPEKLHYCRFCFLLNFSAPYWEIYGWCRWAFNLHYSLRPIQTINFQGMGAGELEGKYQRRGARMFGGGGGGKLPPPPPTPHWIELWLLKLQGASRCCQSLTPMAHKEMYSCAL